MALKSLIDSTFGAEDSSDGVLPISYTKQWSLCPSTRYNDVFEQGTDGKIVRNCRVVKAPSPLNPVINADQETENEIERSVKETIRAVNNFLITEPAFRVILSAKNKEVSFLANRIVTYIGSDILLHSPKVNLPYVRASEGDDGSILIEWIFPSLRIGFGIETEIEESGWYLITKPPLGNVRASGVQSEIDIRMLISWLVSLAITASSISS